MNCGTDASPPIEIDILKDLKKGGNPPSHGIDSYSSKEKKAMK